jgi:predicted PurR-regulated permease PerM
MTAPEIDHPSPKWSNTTKLLISLIVVVLLGLAIWWFQALISAVVIAAMIAYLINPLASWLAKRLDWPRTVVLILIYLLLLVILAASATGLIVNALNQVVTLSDSVQEYIVDLPARIDALTHSQVNLFGYTIDFSRLDLNVLYNQIVAYIQPAVSRAAEGVGAAVLGTAQFFGQALFVLVISFYMAKDYADFGDRIGHIIADSGYQADLARLVDEFQTIWNSFLRGQALVSLTTMSVVSVGLSILGVRYAVALGLFAGLMDFIPMVGPSTAVILSVAVALFQDGNWLGLSPIVYAAIVFVFYMILQQSENYFLVPRIIGGSLNLSPLLIFVGAIMGASLGGILGLLLAAPILATLRLLGRYTWRKMLDLPPFPDEPEKPKPQSKPAFDFSALFRRIVKRNT